MLVLFCLVSILTLPFKSKNRLEAENVAIRHQLMVLRRQAGSGLYFSRTRPFVLSTSPERLRKTTRRVCYASMPVPG